MSVKTKDHDILTFLTSPHLTDRDLPFNGRHLSYDKGYKGLSQLVYTRAGND